MQTPSHLKYTFLMYLFSCITCYAKPVLFQPLILYFCGYLENYRNPHNKIYLFLVQILILKKIYLGKGNNIIPKIVTFWSHLSYILEIAYPLSITLSRYFCSLNQFQNCSFSHILYYWSVWEPHMKFILCLFFTRFICKFYSFSVHFALFPVMFHIYKFCFANFTKMCAK